MKIRHSDPAAEGAAGARAEAAIREHLKSHSGQLSGLLALAESMVARVSKELTEAREAAFADKADQAIGTVLDAGERLETAAALIKSAIVAHRHLRGAA